MVCSFYHGWFSYGTSGMGQNRRIGSIHWESACPPTPDDLLQGGERREGPIPDSCAAQKLGELLDAN
jgi:hypothetical protein